MHSKVALCCSGRGHRHLQWLAVRCECLRPLALRHRARLSAHALLMLQHSLCNAQTTPPSGHRCRRPRTQAATDAAGHRRSRFTPACPAVKSSDSVDCSSRGWGSAAVTLSMMVHSMVLMVTGGSLMPSTQLPSQGAGHTLPVNSGKLLVCSSLYSASCQRPLCTNSFHSGIKLPSGQPAGQQAGLSPGQLAECCRLCASLCRAYNHVHWQLLSHMVKRSRCSCIQKLGVG